MTPHHRGNIALPLAILWIGTIGSSVCAFAQPCEPAWNGTIGIPGLDAPLHALAVFDDGHGEALYAGGEFTHAGGVEVNHIARWDGRRWTPVGGGFNRNGYGWGMIVFDDGSGPALFAAGWFTEAAGEPANRVAKWDGNTWSPLGLGLDDMARDWAIFDDGSGPALYVGGWFTMAGGQQANHVAKWDGHEWSALGTGTNRTVYELAVFDDGHGPALYAGGMFTEAGGVPASRIAKWDGHEWSALGEGVAGDNVGALTVFDDGNGADLYVGGGFTEAGGVPANNVARWTGEVFEPVGTGVDRQVVELAVHDFGAGPQLFVGGWFKFAGEHEVNGIARWDGRAWRPLSDEAQDYGWRLVFTMTSLDDQNGSALVVGGWFYGPDNGCRTEENISQWRCPSKPLNCDRVYRFKARCKARRSTVKATLRSTDRGQESGSLTVTLDGVDPKTVQFKRCYNKIRVKWPHAAPGLHDVCIVECPRYCARIECP